MPAERAAHLIGTLLGIPVSAGFADKAASRLECNLWDAGFGEAMETAVAACPAQGADEVPVNVLEPGTGADAAHPAK